MARDTARGVVPRSAIISRKRRRSIEIIGDILPNGDKSPKRDVTLDNGGCVPLSSFSMSINDFISRCDRYCQQAGVSRVWLSKRLFSDTFRIEQLAAGTSDVGVKRLERAVADLSALEAANDDTQSSEAA